MSSALQLHRVAFIVNIESVDSLRQIKLKRENWSQRRTVVFGFPLLYRIASSIMRKEEGLVQSGDWGFACHLGSNSHIQTS